MLYLLVLVEGVYFVLGYKRGSGFFCSFDDKLCIHIRRCKLKITNFFLNFFDE